MPFGGGSHPAILPSGGSQGKGFAPRTIATVSGGPPRPKALTKEKPANESAGFFFANLWGTYRSKILQIHCAANQ